MKKILKPKKEIFGIKNKIFYDNLFESFHLLKTTKMNFTFQKSDLKSKDETHYLKLNKEVKKNYDDLVKRFNIKPLDIKDLRSINKSNMQNEDLTLKDLKKKYLHIQDGDNADKFNFIIKKIFKEEVLNSKKGKDFDDLVLFIKNCFKYNLKRYLSDPKYFRNKEIRKKVLNTDLMEKLYQENSPFDYQKELQKRVYAGNYYKIIKNEKNEKPDFLTSQEIEKESYKYMNFLAENSVFKKLTNQMDNVEHNKKLVSEYQQSERKLENVVEDLTIDKEISENFYIDFLMKMKEKEKEKSMGLSQIDDRLFAKRLAENKEEILNKKNINNDFESENTNQEDIQQTAFREETQFNSFTDNIVEENLATYMQNGIDTPHPYYGAKDYPYDEFFSDNYMKGTTYMVSTLREHGTLPVHPPKIDVISDIMHIDAMRWQYFTMIPNFRNYVKKYTEILKNIKNDKDLKKSGNKNFSFPEQSLIPYYNLLPKWAHENPTIQNIVRGLEYHQHGYSFRQKVTTLNIALPLLLPLDDKLTDVAKELYGYFKTHPSLENIDELFEHNEEESRKSVFLPDDDFTDDKEEFYTFYTAADIRAIEKEEEEERKQKKKEEGRAKRAAEEAKAAAEKGEKKDAKSDGKADEKKKGNETEEQAVEEVEEKEEEEEEEAQRQGEDTGSFDLFDNQEAEEDLAMKAKKPKIKKEAKVKEENKYITQRKEALKLVEVKKEQDKLFGEFLKKHDLQLNENFINITRDMIDVQTGKLNLSKVNFKEISLSTLILNKFVNEFGLTKDQLNEFLEIIKKNPNVEVRIAMGKDSQEEHIIYEKDNREKEKEKVPTKETTNEEENELDLTEIYRSSLRETEIKIDNEDDSGLKDVYYKPVFDVDFHFKTTYLPLDYYDNDDGFYDDYLKQLQDRIDITQYNTKPFMLKRRRIKHISEIDV